MKHRWDGRKESLQTPRPLPLASSHQRAVSALVIFAKAPTPGQVKTRLCPPLTPDEAATLHGSFVLDTLERTKTAVTKLKLPMDRYLACAPSSTLVFFKIMEERQAVRLIDQEGDKLGERMSRTFETMFQRGYRHVIIVGTDVPSLPLDYYKQALAELDTHDMVLGPALDGGYYLIGLNKPAPAIFENIPWSTDQVLALTREKADGLDLSIGLVPEWQDVDTVDDLKNLIDASALDAKKPKHEQAFSNRTSGALQLIAKRLRTRA
jgi:rSAM/selenodomain-associated transferase 1